MSSQIIIHSRMLAFVMSADNEPDGGRFGGWPFTYRYVQWPFGFIGPIARRFGGRPTGNRFSRYSWTDIGKTYSK